jgi:hypothetical protein
MLPEDYTASAGSTNTPQIDAENIRALESNFRVPGGACWRALASANNQPRPPTSIRVCIPAPLPHAILSSLQSAVQD